jgi:hypothetical protein
MLLRKPAHERLHQSCGHMRCITLVWSWGRLRKVGEHAYPYFVHLARDGAPQAVNGVVCRTKRSGNVALAECVGHRLPDDALAIHEAPRAAAPISSPARWAANGLATRRRATLKRREVSGLLAEEESLSSNQPSQVRVVGSILT